jgi:predicted O-methyltransferase YrrM
MALRQEIKRLLFASFPDTSLRFFSARSRRQIENYARECGLDRLAMLVSAQTGGTVLTGPFKGIRLNCQALAVHSAPKFLGTYEKEIVPFIEDAIALKPANVLNVGSSDGYYAVGLAKRLPGAIIYAAEADRKSLRATLQNAKLNSIESRVRPIGIVHSGDFGKFLKVPYSLIVMDCEGAEFKLLVPNKDPILKKTHILVEIHENHGSLDDILRRFSRTHSIQTVAAVERTVIDLPAEARELVPPAALDEHRGRQIWVYMRAK